MTEPTKEQIDYMRNLSFSSALLTALPPTLLADLLAAYEERGREVEQWRDTARTEMAGRRQAEAEVERLRSRLSEECDKHFQTRKSLREAEARLAKVVEALKKLADEIEAYSLITNEGRHKWEPAQVWAEKVRALAADVPERYIVELTGPEKEIKRIARRVRMASRHEAARRKAKRAQQKASRKANR